MSAGVSVAGQDRVHSGGRMEKRQEAGPALTGDSQQMWQRRVKHRQRRQRCMQGAGLGEQEGYGRRRKLRPRRLRGEKLGEAPLTLVRVALDACSTLRW